ncbi:G-patch domain and KOW motifs-containing protein [Aethina tumida]|uniref:G-patch domain and KOW motifs-containing protein n=1 Tax=Aethina tumida TaxID=116153 RepID=UPI0021489604|nr:G-patch domain and KOW motifs-containing protein [Aethina tumida]
MEEPKKISFGFSKLVKKSNVVTQKPKKHKQVELIDCLEGQSIKIKGAIEEECKSLIIPIKDNQKNLLDRVKEARAKKTQPVKNEIIDNRPDSELTIEELAAREVIKDAQKRLEQVTNHTTKVSVLPALEDKLTLEGEAEPTLDDYENVPINDFGLAMLRGMGWKDGDGIGKNPAKNSLSKPPDLRPKGLGLGANRQIKENKPKSAVDKNGKELILIKGAFAKIIAGANKGHYCEVQGLDDEGSRVIVKTSLKNEILNVNEFLLVPVTKEEFAKGCKVINNAKYEEYKEIMDRKLEQQRNMNSEKDSEELQSKNKYNDYTEYEDDKYEKQNRTDYKDYPSSSRKHSEYKYKNNGVHQQRDKSEERGSNKRTSRRDYRSSSDSSSERYNKKSVFNSDSSSEDRSRSRHKSKHRSKSRSSDRKHRRKYRSASRESSSYVKKKGKKKKSKSKRRDSSDSEEYTRKHRKNKR